MKRQHRSLAYRSLTVAALLCRAVYGQTYPTEAWPTDASVLLLNGTTDSKTGLPWIAKGVGPNSTPTLQVQYDRRVQRENAMLAALNQGRVVAVGGLNVGVFPLRYLDEAGAETFYAGTASTALTDGVTRYIWINVSNALTTGAAFPADASTYLPLAKAITSGGAITTLDDMRSLALFQIPFWSPPFSLAHAGANSDITSITGLTTMLAVNQGGTAGSTAGAARTNLGAAASGANSDITSITGLTTPLAVAQGGTGAATLTGVLRGNGTGAVTAAAVNLATEATGTLLVSNGGTGQTTAPVVPYPFAIFFSGNASVKTYEAELVAPVALRIKDMGGRVRTAPAVQSVIVDLRVNGASIYANQAEMVNIVAGGNQDTSAAKDHAVAAGDVLTFEVEQVGTGTPGADLTLVVNSRATLTP